MTAGGGISKSGEERGSKGQLRAGRGTLLLRMGRSSSSRTRAKAGEGERAGAGRVALTYRPRGRQAAAASRRLRTRPAAPSQEEARREEGRSQPSVSRARAARRSRLNSCPEDSEGPAQRRHGGDGTPSLPCSGGTRRLACLPASGDGVWPAGSSGRRPLRTTGAGRLAVANCTTPGGDGSSPSCSPRSTCPALAMPRQTRPSTGSRRLRCRCSSARPVLALPVPSWRGRLSRRGSAT